MCGLDADPPAAPAMRRMGPTVSSVGRALPSKVAAVAIGAMRINLRLYRRRVVRRGMVVRCMLTLQMVTCLLGTTALRLTVLERLVAPVRRLQLLLRMHQDLSDADS